MSSLENEVPDTPEKIHEFEEYLRTTLGPDLLASGFLATGEDVLTAARIIRVLLRMLEEDFDEGIPPPP